MPIYKRIMMNLMVQKQLVDKLTSLEIDKSTREFWEIEDSLRMIRYDTVKLFEELLQKADTLGILSEEIKNLR